MQKYRRTLFVTFFIGFSFVVPHEVVASPSALPDTVQTALKQANIPATHIGIFVQPVEGTQPALAYGEDRSMNPASVMKLLTTFAGLELLGPAYNWKTEIYANGQVADGVLKGDLIIKGYGDPELTIERFWLMLRELRQRGVRDIRGDLVLDKRFFVYEPHDPGAFDKQAYQPYNVGPDALLLNFNVAPLRLQPQIEQRAVLVQPEFALTTLTIRNAVTLDNAPCGDWEARLNIQLTQTTAGAVVDLAGPFSAACGEKQLSLSFLRNGDFVNGLFRQLWGEMGGSISGVVRVGDLPAGARLMVTKLSPPLAEVVRNINKFSNNVMARQLYLTIGAEQSGLPGSRENAGMAIRHWLTGRGLNFPELVVENGAGLSRIARISSQHLAELLLTAYRSPVFSELESSLPIVAVDGTMRRRMKDNGVAGHAHIKSGSVDGVKTIAGYLFDKKGRRMVVVFMINHPNATLGRGAQDALLDWVYTRP